MQGGLEDVEQMEVSTPQRKKLDPFSNPYKHPLRRKSYLREGNLSHKIGILESQTNGNE